MTDVIDNLLNLESSTVQEDDKSEREDKKQKLLECVVCGNSKLYLDKNYTEEQINKLKPEEIDKLFTLFESKLAGQITKSLGKTIIGMYSKMFCTALGLEKEDVLNTNLENDPFLNSALQRATCELYYRFGYSLAPVTVALHSGRHYLDQRSIEDSKNNILYNKNGGGENINSGTGDVQGS